MATRFALPIVESQTSGGGVGAGYKLNFYTAGGPSVRQDTHSDDARTSANANPVVADSAGRFGAMFMANALYYVVYTDANDVQIWAEDNVRGMGPGLGADAANSFTGICTFTKNQIWAKGTDIASATPTIPTDGMRFDVTGTTTIAAFTVAADRFFLLQFDGAVQLTHHATNLILPGGANITTAAGDRLVGYSLAANQIEVLAFQPAVLPPSRPEIAAEVATTSGTSVTLTTASPAWAKRITLMPEGMSTNGVSPIILRIGPTAGVEANGYLGGAGDLANASQATSAISTGFVLVAVPTAAATYHGVVELFLKDVTNNTWSFSAKVFDSTGAVVSMGAGVKSLAGVLTDIALTTVGGVNAFNAGDVGRQTL